MGAALAGLLLLLGGMAARSKALLRAPGSPVLLELTADGGLGVELRDGRRAEISTSAPRHVTRFWVVLRTAHPACRTVLVTAGMLGAGEFRRLRIRAWRGGPAGDLRTGHPA